MHNHKEGGSKERECKPRGWAWGHQPNDEHQHVDGHPEGSVNVEESMLCSLVLDVCVMHCKGDGQGKGDNKAVMVRGCQQVRQEHKNGNDNDECSVQCESSSWLVYEGVIVDRHRHRNNGPREDKEGKDWFTKE